MIQISGHLLNFPRVNDRARLIPGARVHSPFDYGQAILMRTESKEVEN